jgi:hypothetical protein
MYIGEDPRAQTVCRVRKKCSSNPKHCPGHLARTRRVIDKSRDENEQKRTEKPCSRFGPYILSPKIGWV